MKNTATANRYSDAIFNIAQEENSISQWIEFLKDLLSIFKEPSVISFFQDPKIKNEGKLDLISNSEIKKDGKQSNFLNLIIEKNNLHIIDLVFKRFNQLVDNKNGIKRAKIITAYNLKEDESERINQKLSDIIGLKIESENIIDKSILGGFIAKFEDQMLDMSAKGKLNRLKESILE